MCGRLGQRIAANLSLRFGDKEATERLGEAENLLNEIASINAPDQVEAAITACDALIARFDSDSEWQIRNIVAATMLHKAALLFRYGKNEEAFRVYEEIAARFSGAQEPALREKVHDALERKRSLLRMIPKSGARLIAAHDELLDYYAKTPEKRLEAKIAMVLLDKADLLWMNRQSEPAIGLCNEIETRFSTSDRTEVREQVAKALSQKSAFLRQIGRVGEANKVFEELVERFSAAPEESIRDWLSLLVASRADAQKKKERAAHIDELIGRFAETGRLRRRSTRRRLRLTWVPGSRFWMNCLGTFPKHPKHQFGCRLPWRSHARQVPSAGCSEWRNRRLFLQNFCVDLPRPRRQRYVRMWPGRCFGAHATPL